MKNLSANRKKCLVLMVLSLAVLIGFVVFACQKGIWQQEHFLYEKADGVWQGTVRGEKLTLTMEGRTLRVSADGAERIYRLEGEAGVGKEIVLYEDDREVFRGSYHDDWMWDTNGEAHFGLRITFTTSDGNIYTASEDGSNEILQPWDLTEEQVVRLFLDPEPERRGQWYVVIYAVILLTVAFVDLWWPELGFRWSQMRHQAFVQRDIMDDEPSDWYYAIQKAVRIVIFISAAAILFVGLRP